jgi:hypothetical protein
MAQFLQSLHDFPLMVRLGRNVPSWELNRWGLDSLRFSPPIENKFSLRGDRRQLQYSGKRESHRFTILDNERFEYDIILNREPETNKLYLRIEGWEGFDFFRQPDTFGPESLRGSYAVYRKESIVQGNYHTGTGKICHIHRPKILDARGREVWGDIWIDRGVLVITIPEGWLGEAKYPVTVDPIVGTSTVGAYTKYRYISAYNYNYYQQREGNNFNIENHASNIELVFSLSIQLNLFTLTQNLKGKYKLWYYAHDIEAYDGGLWPVLYSCSSSLNSQYLLSNNEQEGNLIVSAGKPEGWRNAEFAIGNQINSGNKIWLGFFNQWGAIRFDYGLPFVQYDTERIDADNDEPFYEQVLNELYVPLEKAPIVSWIDSSTNSRNIYPGARTDFRMSMYLENYANAYTRTLTQGVNFTDGQNKKYVHSAVRISRETIALPDSVARNQGIIKTIAQDINIMQILGRAQEVVRRNEQIVAAVEGIERIKGMFRFIQTSIAALDSNKPIRVLNRFISHMAESLTELRNWRGIMRCLADVISQFDTVNRSRGFIAMLQAVLGLQDKAGYSNEWGRHIADDARAIAGTGHEGQYLRELQETPEIEAETERAVDYQRFQHDTGNSIGDVKRMLSVFVTLLSASSIRDYIIGRFLKSKEELQIKSKITKELFIDSKIH